MDVNHQTSDFVDKDDEEVEYKKNLPAFRGIGSVAETKQVKTKNANNADRTQEADIKRQNAVKGNWETIKSQKCAVASGLKGETSNKKIIFNEDGDQQEQKQNYSQSTKKTISLFDDDDDDIDNVNDANQSNLVSDFKLKLRFEGEKGKKLFQMQTSKSTGDDRFLMDKRFFDEQEATEKMSDDEIEKQMNILEGVVGRSVTKPKKVNENEIFNMVRYDPTQIEHQKYVKDKPELPQQKKPKRQKLEQKNIVEPIVNTDKYYKVGDNLKDLFSSQNQFNFTSLFHGSDKNDTNVESNTYRAEKILKPQKKFGRNPFIDDSSESENEEDNFKDKEDHLDANVEKVSSEKILGPRGVWRESFFFKIDDSRFKDAEQFYDPKYNEINYSGSQDPRFIKKRDMLRDFLKIKAKRHKRDVSKKMFNRKLGGTHNSKKVHKSIPGKNIKYKSKKKTIMKSNKPE